MEVRGVAVVEVGVGDVDVGGGSVASLRESERAVSALAAEPMGVLSGQELLELVRGLEVVRRRLDAVTDRLAGVVDASGAHGVDGHSSAKAALVHVGRLSGAEAHARVRTARVLSRLPAVAAAYAAGAIPSGHVRAIVRVVSNPRVASYLEVADPVAGGRGSVTSPIPSRITFACGFASQNRETRRPISGNR